MKRILLIEHIKVFTSIYPNTQFKVYDVHNKNVYEYDKKGIKSISNW